jgi:hypothetical protein
MFGVELDLRPELVPQNLDECHILSTNLSENSVDFIKSGLHYLLFQVLPDVFYTKGKTGRAIPAEALEANVAVSHRGVQLLKENGPQMDVRLSVMPRKPVSLKQILVVISVIGCT